MLTLGADELPPDAMLKFYKTVVVQDLVFKRDNVEYTLAVYYSPSLHTTFEAPCLWNTGKDTTEAVSSHSYR